MDPPLNEALVAPYLQPNVNARYEVIQGSVPFHGPTIPGEGRELCGSAIGFHLLTAPAADLRSCLPTRLAALGYDTIAVHGMSGHMFNRSTWYSTIGFRERWFHEQLQQQGLPDCTGVFTGTCDADIAAWIGRRLEEDSSRPKFVHWMTLNSHLPVPVPSYLTNGAPCLASIGLQPNSPLCSWYQLVANVHRSVAQLAAGPLSRSTVFVIVGDHAPPFGDPVLHSRFSQSDVPYVVLLPRAQRNPSRAMLAHNAVNPTSGSAQPPRQLP
jgi:phosphoglycerol transferase MdoB-like AlkP superfamily enzyme